MKYLKMILDGLSVLSLSILSVLALTSFPLNIQALACMFLAYGLVMVFAYMYRERKDRYFPSLLRCEMLLIMLYVTWTHVTQEYQPYTIFLLSLMFGSSMILDQKKQEL